MIATQTILSAASMTDCQCQNVVSSELGLLIMDLESMRDRLPKTSNRGREWLNKVIATINTLIAFDPTTGH